MKIKLLIFSIFFSVSIFSQNSFEGILTFKMKLTDNKGEMTQKEANTYLGTKQTYYLKGNKYKSVTNGLLGVTTYHEGKDTLFTHLKGQDMLLYQLSNINDEKVISYEFKDSNITILGMKCKLLEVKSNKGFYQYYYNENLKVDIDTYKNHKLGLWDFFTSKTNGALSIISISKAEDFNIEIELISIERKKLDDDIFMKPKLPIQEYIE